MSWDGPAAATFQVDYRWGVGNLDRVQLFAKELIQLNPEVLIAVSTAATAAEADRPR
jgi:hypothetical protein